MSFSIYNNVLKQIDESSSACLSYGGNDEARFISWVENSYANRLLVVTDIDEMSAEMKEFMGKYGIKTKGDGVKNFTSKDLVGYAVEFAKGCK